MALEDCRPKLDTRVTGSRSPPTSDEIDALLSPHSAKSRLYLYTG